jgi:hypothetical protein
MKLGFSEEALEKFLNIIYHENSSGGSPVTPCGRTDGQTNMQKVIVTFLDFTISTIHQL